MISHELRTPMAAIKGYVKILLDTETNHLSDSALEYLETIDISITQLLSLANELIDLSRLESGEIELYPDWIDLTRIVQQAAQIVDQDFTSRNLGLTIELEEALPELYLDKNRILQVLLNLLSNAYKYTTKGGATVKISQSETEVFVEVADTGIGIDEADQPNMFTRFFRANDHLVQKVSGTGLGLSITKGLVELHGGHLTFKSRYRVGTTFRLSLPKHKAIPGENATGTVETVV
jgi:signal transduction histidine kinase